MTFKVGDKVRRKKEHRGKYGWTFGDKILTVKERILYRYSNTINLVFDEIEYNWKEDYFELAEKQLGIGDVFYIIDPLGDIPRTIVGEDGDKWIYRNPYASNSYMSIDKYKCFPFPQVEEWWVPVFKEMPTSPFNIASPFNIGRDHFSSKKECDEAWEPHHAFIGSIRVDKNAKKFNV